MRELDNFITCTNGRYIDVDGFPRGNKYQCFDLFAYFCRKYGMPLSIHCSLTGYVPDIFRLANSRGYAQYFDIVSGTNDIQEGDWVFWDSPTMRHVALKLGGVYYLTQNPGKTTIKTLNSNGIIGVLRPKFIPNWVQNAPSVNVIEEARNVIRGVYGNGLTRRQNLINKFGNVKADEIQRKVNEILGGK